MSLNEKPYEESVSLTATSPKWVWNRLGNLSETPSNTAGEFYDPITVHRSLQSISMTAVQIGAELSISLTDAADYRVGSVVAATSADDINVYIGGIVTSSSPGVFTLLVRRTNGAGDISDWIVAESLGQCIETTGSENQAKNSFDVSLWLNGPGLTAGTYEGYNAVFETADNENHAIMLDASATDGLNYTRYIIAKPIGRRYVGVSYRGFAVLSPSGLNWDVYDTQTDQWNYDNRGFSAQKLSHGFYRFSISRGARNADSNKFGLWATDEVSVNNLFLGDPTKGLAVICGQYEPGPVCTSPIKTTAAPVARDGDGVSIQNVDQRPWFNSGGFTFYGVMRLDYLNESNTVLLLDIRESSGSYFRLLLSTMGGRTGQIVAAVRDPSGLHNASSDIDSIQSSQSFNWAISVDDTLKTITLLVDGKTWVAEYETLPDFTGLSLDFFPECPYPGFLQDFQVRNYSMTEAELKKLHIV